MSVVEKKRVFVDKDDQRAIEYAKRGLDHYRKNNFVYAMRNLKKAYRLPINQEFAKILLLHMINAMGELQLHDQQQEYVEELFDLELNVDNLSLLVEVYNRTNNEIKIKELAPKIKEFKIENEDDEKKIIDLLFIAKEYSDAINRLQVLIDKYPDDQIAKKKLFNAYTMSNQLEEAYKYSLFLIEQGFEDDYLLEFANMEKELFDFEKSRDNILKHLEIHKENVRGVNIVAQVLMSNVSYNGTLSGDDYIYWARRAMEGTKPQFCNTHFNRDINPFRKIKVGLVSYDFRKHSVGKFILSLFTHIKENPSIETYCYYTYPDYEDGFTDLIKNTVDVFKSVGKYSTMQFKKELMEDNLDILVDLNGQTAGTKLPIIAERLAPIQVTWMGFPFSSFYHNIDYIMGDYYFDDDEGETEKYCTEKILKMDPCYMCFSMMPEEMYIEPEPPQIYNGYITLGMMNNPLKYSEESIKTWQRCLDEIPNSRILVQLSKFSAGFVEDKMIERFKRFGLDMNRVDIGRDHGQDGYYRTYNKVDVMLDSFPFGGGTTTPEAIWMGVPVIGCQYHMRHGRMAYSFMNNVGLGHLCAESISTYPSKVKEISEDVELLCDLRNNLRNRLKDTPLFNDKLFREGFENAMRDAFIKYCYEKNKSIEIDKYDKNKLLLSIDCMRAADILEFELTRSQGMLEEDIFIYLVHEYRKLHIALIESLALLYETDKNALLLIIKANDLLSSIVHIIDEKVLLNVIKLIRSLLNNFVEK